MPTCLISVVKALGIAKSSCEAYLAHVIDTRITNNIIENIPVVNKFSNVFSDDLLGLPLDREV